MASKAVRGAGQPGEAEPPSSGRAPSVRGKAAVAADVGALFYRVIEGWRRELEVRTASLELTPGEIKALASIDLGQPQAMRALADAWHCDASNVTWIVDRLESRGLVERQPSVIDRRVKTIALTPHGTAVREQITCALQTGPTQFLTLAPAELETLRDILLKVVDGVDDDTAADVGRHPHPEAFRPA